MQDYFIIGIGLGTIIIKNNTIGSWYDEFMNQNIWLAPLQPSRVEYKSKLCK